MKYALRIGMPFSYVLSFNLGLFVRRYSGYRFASSAQNLKKKEKETYAELLLLFKIQKMYMISVKRHRVRRSHLKTLSSFYLPSIKVPTGYRYYFLHKSMNR